MGNKGLYNMIDWEQFDFLLLWHQIYSWFNYHPALYLLSAENLGDDIVLTVLQRLRR